MEGRAWWFPSLMVYATVPDAAAWFDDNYFDLEAGESRTITTALRPGLTAENVTVRNR